MREVAEVEKGLVEQRKHSRMPQLMTDASTERDRIYESLGKDTEAQPENEPEVEKVEVKTEETPDKAEYIPEKEDKPKDEKMVPLDALHEERGKRKELAKKVKELEEAFKQAADDNKKLMELVSNKSDDEPITDYEKELVNLRKQLKLAMNEIDGFKKGQERTYQETAKEKLEAQAKKADAELEKEGYEGFYKFIPQIVTAMNDEDIPLEERGPDTWKRVYKQIVYPEYIGKFKQSTKELKKEEKENLKKEASLVKSPGKQDSKKKDDDDNSPESYAKWRQSQSFFYNRL